MQLNRKVTGALAWGGVALVLLIPSADFVSGQLGGRSMLVSGDADRQIPAPVSTTQAANSSTPAPMQVAAIDPVEKYLARSGKLPDYISGGSASKAAAPAAPVTTKPASPSAPAMAAAPPPSTTPSSRSQDTALAPAPQVAPALQVAPVPMPAEMRPRPRPNFEPQQAAASPPPVRQEQPLIIDEGPVGAVSPRRERNPLIEPPESFRTVPPEDVLLPPANVGGGVRTEWDDEGLAAYLEREGLVGRPGERRRRQDYDPDGFYLDDGPNGDDDGSSVIFLTR